MLPSDTPRCPPGGLSWGAFVRVACVTQRPLGHAWLGHPGAPGHVCRGQPWGPSSRSIARSPPPLGAWLARPGARPPLCPRPLSFYPPTACRLPRRPPLPPPPDTPPATLPPHHGHAWLRPRSAPDPPDPRNVRRHPPPAAPGAPRRPPAVAPLCAGARRSAALCGGAGGPRGKATPPPLFPGMRGPPRRQQAAATFRASLMTLAQPTPFSPESATSF